MSIIAQFLTLSYFPFPQCLRSLPPPPPSLSLSLSLSISLSLSSLSLSLSLSVSLCLFRFLSVSLCLSFCLSLSLSPSLPLSVSLYLSVCLSVSFSIFSTFVFQIMSLPFCHLTSLFIYISLYFPSLVLESFHCFSLVFLSFNSYISLFFFCLPLSLLTTAHPGYFLRNCKCFFSTFTTLSATYLIHLAT